MNGLGKKINHFVESRLIRRENIVECEEQKWDNNISEWEKVNDKLQTK